MTLECSYHVCKQREILLPHHENIGWENFATNRQHTHIYNKCLDVKQLHFSRASLQLSQVCVDTVSELVF